MKVDVTTRTLVALCLVCTPFLGAADGGCSGGQVAIGGDPATAGSGGTDGKAGSAQSGGSAGSATAGSGSAGTLGSAGSGSGGATSCLAEGEALREFIAANKSCSSDADCQAQNVGCGITEDDCTGAVYVNGDTDLAAFQAQRAAYFQCLGQDAGCPVCARLAAPAACVGGSCVRAGADVCSLPFDAGPCDAAFQVWTFSGGGCVQTIYGGCQGNGNRFGSLEECLGTCGDIEACPPNRVVREICVECGLVGGCSRSLETCALSCQSSDECSPGLNCFDGVCQMGPCI